MAALVGVRLVRKTMPDVFPQRMKPLRRGKRLTRMRPPWFLQHWTFGEWRAVLREEAFSTHPLKLAASMAVAAVTGIFVGPKTRREYERRIFRVCPECPVYDPDLKRCRPFTGASWGCGCYVPLLALLARSCYADRAQMLGLGWRTTRRESKVKR
mgnify:CR=1 FL=1